MNSETDFFRAAASGDLPWVRRLVAEGADVERGKRRRSSNASPLVGAASGGHLAVARFLLLQGADPNAKFDSNVFGPVRHWTPLLEAASRGHRAMVQLLLEHGAALDYIDVLDCGVVRAALKQPDERGWREAERLGRWLMSRGAPMTDATRQVLHELATYKARRRASARVRASRALANAATRFLVLQVDRSAAASAIYRYPKSRIADYEYGEGRALAGRFPKRAQLRFWTAGKKLLRNQIADFSRDLQGGLILRDFIDTTRLGADTLVTTRRVHDLLVHLGASNLEFLPVSLLDLEGKPVPGDHGVLNVMDPVPFIDLTRSRVSPDDLDVDSDEDIWGIEKLYLDRSSIPPNAVIMRAARKSDLFLVRAEVARGFKAEGVTGFRTLPANGARLS